MVEEIYKYVKPKVIKIYKYIKMKDLECVYKYIKHRNRKYIQMYKNQKYTNV